MIKVQIIEDEGLQCEADFENAEVWLLSLTRPDMETDRRLVVVKEIAESEQPPSYKLPLLMSEIYQRHPPTIVKQMQRLPVISDAGTPVMDECGMPVMQDVETDFPEPSFSYEVITRNKENFAVHAYVCDEDCIKTVPQDK